MLIKTIKSKLLVGLAMLLLPVGILMAQTPTVTPPPTPVNSAEAVPIAPEHLAVMAFLLAMAGIWFLLRKRSSA